MTQWIGLVGLHARDPPGGLSHEQYGDPWRRKLRFNYLKGDQSGHDSDLISALKEGVIGVNRQSSKSLEFNRPRSKL